jgi:hypothetical protein
MNAWVLSMMIGIINGALVYNGLLQPRPAIDLQSGLTFPTVTSPLPQGSLQHSATIMVIGNLHARELCPNSANSFWPIHTANPPSQCRFSIINSLMIALFLMLRAVGRTALLAGIWISSHSTCSRWRPHEPPSVPGPCAHTCHISVDV